MRLSLTVYAPTDSPDEYEQLADTFVTELAAAVYFSGKFHVEGKQPAAIPLDLDKVLAGVDFERYWAILKIQLNTPLAHAVLGAAAKHIIDLVVRWATERSRTSAARMKVRLYGPDGELLTERDV